MARLRLTRKFADFIDGIDLRKVKSGDALDLSPAEARILLAEGWARADDRKTTTAQKKMQPDGRRRQR